jgi:glycosyltransferase involved in cell wall biosynthesis
VSPRISVLTPVYNPPTDVLQETIDSVRNQTFGDWELCLVNDCSTDPAVAPVLDQAALSDPRIKVLHRETNGGITAASSDALSMATGEFVALLDHDDLLHVEALRAIAETADQHPNLDYCYSDEAHLSPVGEQITPFFKPDWSPERLRSQNYCTHFSVFRRTLAIDVGGFRAGFDGSQDYDLILRVTEKARYIHHFTWIMYLWRQLPTSVAGDRNAKPYAYESGRRALQEHADRLGIAATVEMQEPLGTYRFRRHLTSTPKVSIIIPTRGSTSLVWGVERNLVVETVESVLDKETYADIEFIVVADTVTPPKVIRGLEQVLGDQLTLVWYDRKFNFSEKCNLGAAHATGQMYLFLNDDMQVITPDFLTTMVPIAQDPGIGMVGAKLYFADGTLQHAGHVYNGDPYHAMFRWSGEELGPSGLLVVQRECIGVTAACAMIRAEVFDEVGGFTPLLYANFNDVDFSMKIRGAGYRIVWTPYVEMYHFESQTREPTPTDYEHLVIRQRWADQLDRDPYYNPNLAPFRDDWVERALR